MESVLISEASTPVLVCIHRRTIPVRDNSVVRVVTISRPCKMFFSLDYGFADMFWGSLSMKRIII